jgi:hypothetical protein
MNQFQPASTLHVTNFKPGRVLLLQRSVLESMRSWYQTSTPEIIYLEQEMFNKSNVLFTSV